jgi:hypothetical protein
VGEAGHGLGLALRGGLPWLTLDRWRGRAAQELEGDAAVELGVVGLVDDAHAAVAELAEDLEAADVRGHRLEHQAGGGQAGAGGAGADRLAPGAFVIRVHWAAGSSNIRGPIGGRAVGCD